VVSARLQPGREERVYDVTPEDVSAAETDATETDA
jgi:hypothetical protein